MRPKKPKATGSGDLFRARLYQIINMKHELVQLVGKFDWDWIDGEIGPLYSENGRPGIETRFMIRLLLLKHIYGLSDEGSASAGSMTRSSTAPAKIPACVPPRAFGPEPPAQEARRQAGSAVGREPARGANEVGALRGQDLALVTSTPRCSRRPSLRVSENPGQRFR